MPIFEANKKYTVNELLDMYNDYQIMFELYNDEYYELMMFICKAKIYQFTVLDKDEPP